VKNIPIVNSVQGFLNELEEHGFIGEVSMFRGHLKWSWPLVPSIGRLYKRPQADGCYEDWYSFEDQLMLEFKRNSRLWLQREPRDEAEWLVIAQHYGLPTRLLDWTTNPLKALLFAVDDKKDQSDGAVWALTSSGSHEYGVDMKSDSIQLFPPPSLDPRVVAQESYFALFPYPKGDVPIPALRRADCPTGDVWGLLKLRIPRDKKNEIRFYLRKLGITYGSLFPGLEGVAGDIVRRQHGADLS
jgi:hypothetical protein